MSKIYVIVVSSNVVETGMVKGNLTYQVESSSIGPNWALIKSLSTVGLNLKQINGQKMIKLKAIKSRDGMIRHGSDFLLLFIFVC